VVYRLKKTIITYYNKNNNWPYGEKVFLPVYLPDDCPFSGPGVAYSCDAS